MQALSGFPPFSWVQNVFSSHQESYQHEEAATPTYITVARVALGVLSLVATGASCLAFLASGSAFAAISTIFFGVTSIIILGQGSSDETSEIGRRTARTYFNTARPHNPTVHYHTSTTSYHPQRVRVGDRNNVFASPSVQRREDTQRVRVGDHETVRDNQSSTESGEQRVRVGKKKR